MSENIDESINEFVGFFRERFGEIERIANVLYAHQYQKVLFLSAVDTLARVAQPKETNNRKRFISFIEKFSTWSDGCRVSLPHLARLLEKTTDSQFSDLRKFVIQEMKGWKPGRVLPLKVDPELGEIEKLWPESARLDGPLKRFTVDSLTHNKLLYVHRNTLIHEFRSPSADFTNSGPCYMYQSTIGTGGVRKGGVWSLSYPVSFIKGIAVECLGTLEAHLRKTQIDPYHSFVFGDYWLDSLNYK